MLRRTKLCLPSTPRPSALKEMRTAMRYTRLLCNGAQGQVPAKSSAIQSWISWARLPFVVSKLGSARNGQLNRPTAAYVDVLRRISRLSVMLPPEILFFVSISTPPSGQIRLCGRLGTSHYPITSALESILVLPGGSLLVEIKKKKKYGIHSRPRLAPVAGALCR